jgi:hypothetical protein
VGRWGQPNPASRRRQQVGDEVEERAGEVGHQFLWLGGRMLTGEGLPMVVTLGGGKPMVMERMRGRARHWSGR